MCVQPETSDLIGLSCEYPIRTYAPSYRLFESAAVDKKGQKKADDMLALYQKCNSEEGTSEYLVRAVRDIKKGTPLCIVGGQLMERWKAEDHVIAEGGYVMSSELLSDYFYYPRSCSALVLLTNKHHNIAKFVRDPVHRMTDGRGGDATANVATDLILHKKARVYVMLLYALEDIPSGGELFVTKFLGNSHKADHQNMVLAARVSHWYHRWAASLEEAALKANLDHGALAVAHHQAEKRGKKKSKLLLTAQEVRAHMRGVDSRQQSVPVPFIVSEEQHLQAKLRLLDDAGDEFGQTRSDPQVSRVYHYFRRATAERLSADPTAVFADAKAKREKITEMWNLLSEEEKAVWKKKMTADKAAAADQPQFAAIAAAAEAAAHVRAPVATTVSAAVVPMQDECEEESKEERPVASSSSSAAAAASALPSAPERTAERTDLGGQTSPQIVRDQMVLVSLESAMDLTGCQLIPQSVLGSSMTQETRLKLLKIAPRVPEFLSIDGQKYPFDAAKFQALLDHPHGYDPALLEVRELEGLASPCRYFVPPWYRTFGVVAKAPIKKGELLCLYAGEMEQEVQHRCSSYVYSLPTHVGISQFGSGYKEVPDLVVDAAAKGNIGRFFNDNTFRNGMYQDPSAINTQVTWVFNTIPHLIFFAAKDVAAGEELISSYGAGFWQVMCAQSLRSHSAYFSYIRPYVGGLEKLLKSRNVPLPPKPDFVIELDGRFVRKTGDYHPPPEDSDDEEPVGEEDAEEEFSAEYSVERVIGKKFLPNGKVQYLIKWAGYDRPEDVTSVSNTTPRMRVREQLSEAA